MKYIYALLLTLFISNQASAENWIKVYPPQNSSVTIAAIGVNNISCIKYDASQQNIDSIDTDCLRKISAGAIIASSNVIKLDDINYILQYIDTATTIDINLPDNPELQIDLGAIQSINIDMLTIPYLSKNVSIENFPENIREVIIQTNGSNLKIDTLKNIDSFIISEYHSDSNSKSISLDIRYMENIKSFGSRLLLTNGLPEIPESLENIQLLVTQNNYTDILQTLAHLNSIHPNLTSFSFYLKENFETFDVTPIKKIKGLQFSTNYRINTVIQNLITHENHTSFTHEFVSINNLKLPESLESYNSIQSLSEEYPLPNLNQNLKNLALVSIEYPINIPTFPKKIENITFTLGNKMACLPTFPQTLRSFSEILTSAINCIPNETPWVKATATRPLCTDEQFICDKDSFEIVKGKVFLDINNNGVIDNNDQLLPNTIISTDKNQLANSKENGTYGIILRETGAYQFSAQYNHPSFKQSIPANLTINYQEGQTIDSVNFLIQIENKNDVQINGTNLVARPGMKTKVISFVENLSLENKSGLTVKILQPADWTLEEVLPTGYSVSNDTIIWNNVSLLGLKSSSFSVSSTLLPTATILGDAYQYQMWVENEGDITPDNNYYSIVDTIIGSYDPNDKIVNHSTLTPELSNAKELIYTIRFQNTGTDTAFKVVIIDTIIGNLNPASIRVLGASHNYTWNYSGQGIATFVFDNILLPDSNVNEPGSHGFVTLALRPSKDLAVGDSIYNRAGIYFDFNEPVITNHANTRITTVTPVYNRSNIPLSIYPNPAKNQVRVEWKVTEPTILRISDISGKIIRTERLNNGFTDINVSQLPKGLYIVQLQTGQHMAVSKLIVQ